jgi:hypothetical protein
MVQDEDMDMSGGRMSKGEWTEVTLQLMSLSIDIEIEVMDTAVKRCTQALVDCRVTGCFIDIR